MNKNKRGSKYEHVQEKKPGLSLGSFYPAKVTVGFSMLFNMIAIVLFAFALAGATTEGSALQIFYWSWGRFQVDATNTVVQDNFSKTQKEKLVFRTWYGLTSVYEEQEYTRRKESEFDGSFKTKSDVQRSDTSLYSDDECRTINNDISKKIETNTFKSKAEDKLECADCEDTGSFCVAVLITSLALCFLSIILSLVSMLCKEKQFWAQLLCCLCTAGAMCLGYAAMGNYIRDCYYEANANDQDQSFGPGLYLTIIASAILSIFVPIQIIDLVCGNTHNL